MRSSLNPNNENYFSQLDSLRVFAVLMVIFSHWAGYHENLWNDDIFWFNGEVGVKMFFIISGFLITGILLQERYRSEQLQLSKQHITKSFYIRRFLRIFPAYYATIFTALLLSHPDMLQSWKWHVTYLSNLLFALRGEYMGDVSHFWSLAVEEQFYLAWPIMILFLPQRWLLPSIMFCIGIAPIFRYTCMFILKQNDVTVSVLPMSSLDCLAAGALLAYIKSHYTSDVLREQGLKILRTVSLVSGVAFFAFNLFVSFPQAYDWYAVFVSRLLLVPTLLGIVILFANGFKGAIGRILESRLFVFPGKISYGIYLFHFFIPGMTSWVMARIGWAPHVIILLLLNICLLFSIASISWYFLENPVNNLKKYFPYLKAGHVPVPGTSAQPTLR